VHFAVVGRVQGDGFVRSTLDVIIAVKESQLATEEELRMCIVAMAAFAYFTDTQLDDLIGDFHHANPHVRAIRLSEAKEWQETKFNAQKKPMIEWIGEHNMPGHPEYEERMKLFKKIAKDATGLEL
jgi:hypothetical protein